MSGKKLKQGGKYRIKHKGLLNREERDGEEEGHTHTHKEGRAAKSKRERVKQETSV